MSHMIGLSDATAVIQPLLDRLATVPIELDPFPHLVLRDALSPTYYRAVCENLPSVASFAPAEYPGTGRFTSRHGGRPTSEQTVTHHGLVLKDWSVAPVLQPLSELLSGGSFARLLLDRFSAEGSRSGGGSAIPAYKHALFSGSRGSYDCAFGLYKDLPGYEISPHLDHPVKIVTFLLYLDDDSSCPCPTLLCRPKPGTQHSAADATRYDAAAKDGRAGLWLNWDDFDVVREIHGANVLLAFAPNDISFHGVKLPSVQNRKERTVLRGFIARKGYTDFQIIADAESSDSAARA
jgi:hypothetical protein